MVGGNTRLFEIQKKTHSEALTQTGAQRVLQGTEGQVYTSRAGRALLSPALFLGRKDVGRAGGRLSR